MRREFIITTYGALLVLTLIAGCQEKEEVKITSGNVIFDGGNIFQLVEGKLDLIENKGKIVKARVIMRFKNIANRTVSANVSVEFFDKNNISIYKTYRSFINYPPGYTDLPLTEDDLDKPIANIVTYTGEDVEKINHVVIKVKEITT